jgi:integrase
MAIETKTARMRLAVRGKPYWQPLSGGVSLGYRRIEGAGTWSVRLADGKGGNAIKRIAAADDERRADGRDTMTFAQAREAALQLGRGDDDGPKVLTLDDVVRAYEANLKARGGDKHNATRLRLNLTDAMLKRPVALLGARELTLWRDGLVERGLAASGVNRLAIVLKAVLNLAADADPRLSRHPWKVGLSALPGAVVAHNVVLRDDVVTRLIQAAREYADDFGLLVEVLAVTGARISQVAKCQVGDLMDDRLLIPPSRKGRNKKMVPVIVPIPAGLANRLRLGSVGKGQGEPLIPGNGWRTGHHTWKFTRIVEAIGEDRGLITSYALRHTHITNQLLSNLPVQLVAKLHDTSATQIERHYAAAIATGTDDIVRRSMKLFDEPATIIRLRG